MKNNAEEKAAILVEMRETVFKLSQAVGYRYSRDDLQLAGREEVLRIGQNAAVALRLTGKAN
jgi:hypothetical protein